MKIHRIRRAVTMSAMLLGLGGLASCAMHSRIAQDAVEYNKSLAGAQNEQMLLNVVRASKKHPLFFTGVGSLTRVSNGEVGASQSFALGASPGADAPYTLALAGRASGGPTLQLGVLDTEKFMRGIMTPVTMDTLQYYLAQGWHAETLLRLFVRRIDVPNEDEPYVGLFDYWDDFRGYKRYQQRIRDLARGAAGGVKFVRKTVAEPVGPAFESDLADDPDMLELATEEDYGLRDNGNGMWNLVRYKTRYELTLPDGKGPYPVDAATDQNLEEQKQPVGGGFRLYLRSPEAVLYHLGEMMYAELRHGWRSRILRGDKEWPLFSVKCGRPARDACACPLCVTYCGRTYYVDADRDRGETMHVLSLVSQLIALHKSADELPGGGVVTLVGR